jgi:hypothetical protein
MKPLLLSSLAIVLALTTISNGQTRWHDLTPEQQTARVETTREARRQRIRTERIAHRQQAREAGRQQARATRASDLALMAVWIGLAPEVRAMDDARDLAERFSRRPDWKIQTRAQRIAATTTFITNHPAIEAAQQQGAMNAALGQQSAAYPGTPDVARLMKASGTPPIPEPSATEVPDLFTINRQFNWKAPGHSWMKQMLKDIEAAKEKGDTAEYEALTKRYAVWADQYLRQ